MRRASADMSLRRAVCAATVMVLAMVVPRQAHADDETTGVVLLVGGVDAAGAAEAANDAGGATWRTEELVGAPAQGRAAPTEALEATEALYDQGDFPRCLTTLTDPTLELARLLGDGHAEEAARLLVVAAACTIGAGDADRGKELFRRAFVLELELDALLGDVRPDIAEVAEAARREVMELGRVRLAIEAPGTSIEIDGRERRCDRAPCIVRLYPGSHVLGLAALGRARRVEQIELDDDLRIAPRLDAASSDDARAQLAAALAEGRDPETSAFAEAAANAYGAQVVVLVSGQSDRVRASIYDRGRRQTLARQSAEVADGASGVVVRNVINEWRGEVEPGTPWWIWAVVAGAVIVAGVAAYFLLKPEVSSYAFTF